MTDTSIPVTITEVEIDGQPFRPDRPMTLPGPGAAPPWIKFVPADDDGPDRYYLFVMGAATRLLPVREAQRP